MKRKEYSIPVNTGENALHGGKAGFQDVVWDTVLFCQKAIGITISRREYCVLFKLTKKALVYIVQFKRKTIIDDSELSLSFKKVKISGKT